MGDEFFKMDEFYHLEYLQVNAGINLIPTATVQIKVKDEIVLESATGDGPIDAILNAIDKALKIKPKIEDYHVRSVTAGKESMGEVTIRIRSMNKSFIGKGVSTDIIEASAKAYMQAINYLHKQKILNL